MSQPIVGIFREKRDIEEFLFKAPQYKQAYHELFNQLQAKGVYAAILMGQKSYKGKGEFTQHWVQVKDEDDYRFEKRGPITVDVLYDKDHFISDGKVLAINDKRLYDICWSKEKTYEVLGEFHPKTTTAHNQAELADFVAAMPGDKVAVKELTGSSGIGVFVGSKKDAAKVDMKFPLLVQEFIETSGGVPGITKKRHDVRVVLANGEPIIATLRTPPEGGLKSNIGYGGENRLLSVSELPQDLLELCAKIDNKLEQFGEFRLYSIDCGLTPNGWRLFEANSMPGVINQARGEQAVTYQDKVTSFLKQAALVGQKRKKQS